MEVQDVRSKQIEILVEQTEALLLAIPSATGVTYVYNFESNRQDTKSLEGYVFPYPSRKEEFKILEGYFSMLEGCIHEPVHDTTLALETNRKITLESQNSYPGPILNIEKLEESSIYWINLVFRSSNHNLFNVLPTQQEIVLLGLTYNNKANRDS